MTWFWWLSDSGTVVHVADHSGNELAASPWEKPNGWSWDGDYPSEIFSVMQSEAMSAFQSGDETRALRILADAAFDDIKRGEP